MVLQTQVQMSDTWPYPSGLECRLKPFFVLECHHIIHSFAKEVDENARLEMSVVCVMFQFDQSVQCRVLQPNS